MSVTPPPRGWKARLTSYIRRNGGRITRPRLHVAEVFFGMSGHPGFEEVATAVHARWPGIGNATVYRTLNLLRDAGLIEARRFEEGFARYETAASREHHDHLVCLACGEILEFEDDAIEELQRQASERRGFRMVSHRMEIYGTCAKCQEKGIQDPPPRPVRGLRPRSAAS